MASRPEGVPENDPAFDGGTLRLDRLRRPRQSRSDVSTSSAGQRRGDGAEPFVPGRLELICAATATAAKELIAAGHQLNFAVYYARSA
jgi:hypothetical protein